MDSQESSTQMQGVSLSATATRRIAELLDAEPAGTRLRVEIKGGGCSGFQYRFDFDPTLNPDDHVIEAGAARVVIDQASLEFMNGSMIDWVDNLIGQSFQIRNPLAKSSCGCGTSFSV